MTKKLARGELEARVMDILWAHDAPMTPRDVYDVLARRRQAVAYTTVMTILVRLWKKDLLDREARGRAFSYHPVMSREEWTARRMREMLRASGDRAAALALFAQSIGTRDAAELRRALQRRRGT